LLPDFPKQKAYANRVITQWLRDAVRRHAPLVAAAPRHIHHEGADWLLTREDHTTDTSPYQKISSVLTLTRSDVLNLSLEELLKRIDQLAREIAGQQERYVIDRISEAATQVGNVVEARHRPLDPELFLQTLEKLWIEFNPDGSPRMPTIATGPEHGPQIRQVLRSLSTDLVLKRRMTELLERKREAWNARQASRRLAD
jgi:hypothetical protein